ncbi:hypothetical protein D1AOALGA4SA_10776 [Olavius algarvensis Delta 1 endosymbiont]|nr:hypothetical protein D1AOALGA4SA_10776 [Olavius algarvensis Delta 1 endosymbiont]
MRRPIKFQYRFLILDCGFWIADLRYSICSIEWTHKRKNSHYISMIR